MRGLNGLEVTRQPDEVPRPVFSGAPGAPRIGVVADGLGSAALVQALQTTSRHRAGLVLGIAGHTLAACDAVILPERLRPAAFSKAHCWLIWDWVEAGGRLLLTHDAVGYREHPILFPWVCSGGTAHVASRQVEAVWAPDGQPPLGLITHAATDHILLHPCIRAPMTVIARDPETQEPVVAGARWSGGRVVACGIALGVGPDGVGAPPQSGELRLLEATLAWLLT